MRFLAQLFSFLFHPFILASLLPFIVVYHTSENITSGVKWMLFSIVFLLVTVFVLFLLKPSEMLHDFDISDRKKRPFFYTVAIIFSALYFIAASMLRGFFFPLSVIALGIVVAIIAFDIANKYAKVSIHVGVASAYVVTLWLLFGLSAFLFTLWIPFAVGWSRIFLKKHTLREVALGGLLGVMITGITFVIGERLV